MKPIKIALILAAVLAIPTIAPATASAQGYYAQPGYAPAPGYRDRFHRRMGRLAWGFSIGVGGMNDHGSGVTSCTNCDYNPLAFELDGHIGGMLTNRFALLFEGQVNGQTVNQDAGDGNGSTTLTQSVAMIAGQYWLTPQLWIKGGLGFAHLEFDSQYSNASQDIDSGVAIMGAIGYELYSGRNFAMDLQGRIIDGSYSGINDHITAGNIGLGFNWY
jgi:hypothetical protein